MQHEVQFLLKTIFDAAFGKIFNCDNELLPSFGNGVIYPEPSVYSKVQDVETLLTNYRIEENNLVFDHVERYASAIPRDNTRFLYSREEHLQKLKELHALGFEFALTLSADGDQFQLLLFNSAFRDCVLKNRSNGMTPIVLRFDLSNVP